MDEIKAAQVEWEQTRALTALTGKQSNEPVRVRGKTLAGYLLQNLRSIQSSVEYEVLVALPFTYSVDLLAFITLLLEAATKTEALQKVKSTAKEEETEEVKSGHHLLMELNNGSTGEESAKFNSLVASMSLESLSQIALSLVEIHSSVLLGSTLHRNMLNRLHRCLLPLLEAEKKRHLFNGSASGILHREMMVSSQTNLEETLGLRTSKKPHSSRKRIAGKSLESTKENVKSTLEVGQLYRKTDDDVMEDEQHLKKRKKKNKKILE
eukprot:Filipodium_phascolosomae@DN5599_c0_g1_i1.p1